MEELKQHLLFHKAMTEDPDSYMRIGGYMDILANASDGERLQDPIDESIRSVFSLVLENGIDPWEIDLSEFVKMYNRKVANNSFDMIVAGKLLLMAYRILRMQSDSTRVLSEPPEEPEYVEDDIDCSFFEDDERPMYVPDVMFREAYHKEPTRPVTMYELIEAFDEARKEIDIQMERERVRIELKSKAPMKFENKAHDEDDEKAVELVWQRILRLGAGQIPITDLYVDDIRANITTFVSILHLVRDGRLDVRQESLPYGEILVEIRTDGVTGSIEDEDSRIPEAVI
jgi:segregation and condensation protein A